MDSMIISIGDEDGQPEPISEETFSRLEILEREHLEEWAIKEPRVLGEDLLIITSEFGGFEDIRDRLDILALDRNGKLVVAELKRDRADRTTDLQAIKYASYCATLTAEEIQKEYRDFWSDRRGEALDPNDVGEDFLQFLEDTLDQQIGISDEGWAEFELDQKPRILLAAGEFGTEVTSPVMWLIEEYGMEITCTKLSAYKLPDRVLINSQQVIPVAEAEEYMTKRRQKQQEQESGGTTEWTLDILMDNGILKEGDVVYFAERKVPDGIDREYEEGGDFWTATFTGQTGQTNNIRWHEDGETYSFTGLTREILHRLVGRPKDDALNGYAYWQHSNRGERTLLQLREEVSG